MTEDPERMTDSIIRGKVIFRRLLDHLCNNLIYRILRSVVTKTGLVCAPAVSTCLVRSISLSGLVNSCFLIRPDSYSATLIPADDAILPVINHLLTVNIKTGFPILNQNAIRYQPA